MIVDLFEYLLFQQVWEVESLLFFDIFVVVLFKLYHAVLSVSLEIAIRPNLWALALYPVTSILDEHPKVSFFLWNGMVY